MGFWGFGGFILRLERTEAEQKTEQNGASLTLTVSPTPNNQ